MDVNTNTNVSASYSQTTVSASYSHKQTNQNSSGTTTAETTVNISETSEAAKVEISSAEDRKKGNPYKVDRDKVQQLIDQSNRQTDAFVKMIQKLLNKQGEYSNTAFPNQNQMVPIDNETREWAKKEIADDGYYGVEKTTERLLGFAKAISGGDPSKIEELKNAVTKGFEQAAKMWGGKEDISKLPEISQKTYDAVMKGFDDWAKESNKNASEITTPIA